MSTSVTFAGHLTKDPGLLHTGEKKPFASRRVMATNRIRNAEGKWVDGEPTVHHVKVYGTAAINLADLTGRTDRVIAHEPVKTTTWTDRDIQHKRTERVVEVSNRFGEVGGFSPLAAARTERQRPSASSAEPWTADEQPAIVETGLGSATDSAAG